MLAVNSSPISSPVSESPISGGFWSNTIDFFKPGNAGFTGAIGAGVGVAVVYAAQYIINKFKEFELSKKSAKKFLEALEAAGKGGDTKLLEAFEFGKGVCREKVESRTWGLYKSRDVLVHLINEKALYIASNSPYLEEVSKKLDALVRNCINDAKALAGEKK